MRIFERIVLSSAALMAFAHVLPAIAATPADTLVIARNLTDHFSLDPAEAFEVSNGDIDNNLYTRLIARDPDNSFKLVPGVAESWEILPGGLTARFKIRKDLKFQSGRAVTAEDAAFSLQRGVMLRKASAYIIRQFGWDESNVKERVRAEGDDLVLTLDKPYAPDLLFNALTATIASVVDKTEVLAHEQNGDFGNVWLRSHSVGSGAFRIVDYKAKEVAVLEANPAFYRGAPGVKRVVIRNVPESATQQLLIEKGDVDIARNLSPDQLEVVKRNPDVVIQTNPKATVYYLSLNIARPALNKPEVWEALRWLIDYDAIAERLLKGHFKVNQTFLAEGLLGALPGHPYHLDPARAKALLAKAGIANGLEVTLEVRPATPYAEIGEALQNTFALGGVKLNLVRGDSLQILTRYRERKHDLQLSIKALDYADPNSTAEFFTRNSDDSDTASNRNGAWRNHWFIPELTKRTSDAVVEQDREKRAAIYQELQKEVQNNSPIIFLLEELEENAIRKNVTGFRSGPAWDAAIYDLVKKQ
jgi:peptide/nickel transport system substrate-binding protein